MDDRYLLILYGTQTGTAQDVAEQIGREAKRRYFKTRLMSMEDYPVVNLPQESLVIFVCSTTGQGEVPDNMKAFWKFLLRKSLPPDSLRTVKTAVFGLGDSGYTKYNFVGKKLARRLEALGAQMLLPRGDGDDQAKHGLYSALTPWCADLWRVLLEVWPLPEGTVLQPDDVLLPPKYALTLTREPVPSVTPVTPVTDQPAPYDSKRPYMARLVSNERITAADWEQDVRHIVLDLDESGISYTPGDVVYIRPENPPETDDVLAWLGYDPELVLTAVEATEPDTLRPELSLPITVRQLFRTYCDVWGVPRRHFFEQLAHFATEPLERDRLRYFASPQGQDELLDYCTRARRSCFDVLKDFPSARPPLERVLEVFPRLQPRPFSIASSLLAHPRQIHVAMVVVKYKSTINRLKRGLCSTWLSKLAPQQHELRVPIWVKPGTMRLPAQVTTPIIAVGPGTGCAIFRAFFEERAQIRQQSLAAYPPSRDVFVFGCRHAAADWLYRDEWLQLRADHVLHTLLVAHSRDQPHKQYVQHLLLEHAALVWDLLQHQGAVFYLSGSAKKMPKDVRAVLKQIVQREGALSEDAADTYLRTLELKDRYMTETWF